MQHAHLFAAGGDVRAEDARVLTVATIVVPAPGFREGTAAHPTDGLEPEPAIGLVKRFGLKSVRIELVHCDRIVGGQLGGADPALDLITTNQRQQFPEFSAPHLDGAPTVVVRNGTSVPDLATPQQLIWAAVRATTFVNIIEQSIAPNTVKIYDNSVRAPLDGLPNPS